MAIKVSRIEKEFILKTLADSTLPIETVVAGTRCPSKLVTIKGDDLVFQLQNPPENLGEKKTADLYIMFKGTRVTCRVELVSLVGDKLTTRIPESLYRDLSREYERIHPEQAIRVSLLLEGMQYKLNFRPSEEYYEPEPPSVDIKFDAARISNLLRGFRDKALSFASENKIVMFRERKPTEAPENLVAWSGKTLLLPIDDAETLIKQRDGRMPKLLSQDDVTRIIRSSGEDPIQFSRELSGYLDSALQKKIWHEVYCPVLFREYVVGYIYLMRGEQQSSPFSVNTLEFVQQFSRLLSYSLLQNGYFQSMQVRESFEKSELVDISGSGLLFSFPFNGPSIGIYTDLDLEIQIGEKTIPIKGRVMRRFQDSDLVYIGVKFLEISMEDSDFLLTYLYGEDQNIGFVDDPIIS